MIAKIKSAATAMYREQKDAAPHLLLYAITAIAILLGLWGRFKGLGAWPLHTDEYYIARSVENVLRTGLPAYQCGGFYTRGLLFQYLVATLQLCGMSAELSARLIAAVASVIALPAVYLLGRRLHGRTVGLIAVSVISLSVWEVDMARFGRMYAPFQAIFVWYLVFFLRYTVDRQARALGPMLALTLLGIFTWEGGIFLALANLLPPFIRSPEGRLSYADVRYLVLATVLVVLGYVFSTAPFRIMGTDPYPPGIDVSEAWANKGGDYDLTQWVAAHPIWIAAGLMVVALAFAGLRWPWSIRRRWPAALGLTVVLVSALLHQFAAVALVLVTLLIAGMLRWREFLSRDALLFTLTIFACAVGWTGLAFSNPDWLASMHAPWDHPNRLLLVAYEFLRLPDVIGVVVLPWAHDAPILGIILLVMLALAVLRVIAAESQEPAAEQATLVLLVCMVAGASLSDPPRHEMRYVFFLFPAAVAIAVAGIARIVHARSPKGSSGGLATLAIVAAGFAVTGDLLPRRLMHIDSASANFDLDLRPGMRSNVLGRSDPRGAAEWLANNAHSTGAIVINAYPSVDFYHRNFDFAYVDSRSRRYGGYACSRGTLERWGNLPLLSSVEELNSKIKHNPRVVIVIDTRSLDSLLRSLAAPEWRIAWESIDGNIAIVDIGSTPADR